MYDIENTRLSALVVHAVLGNFTNQNLVFAVPCVGFLKIVEYLVILTLLTVSTEIYTPYLKFFTVLSPL